MASPTDTPNPVIKDIQDFDLNSGSLVERMLFNNRPVILLICLFVTAFLGYQATQAKLNPAARASQMQLSAKITMYSTYSVPVILLIILGIYALLLWAGFNFGLGARTTFGQVWAVTWYASLPYLLTSVVGILTLLFGANIDSYDIRNPVGTNPAYYMPDASPMLRAALTQVDLIHLWSVVLTIIGMSIVAKKSMGASAVIVVLLWFVGVGLAMLGAFFS